MMLPMISRWMAIIAALFASGPFFLSELQAQGQETRPNIIFIVADDLGYADLSGYGRSDYQTPTLDAFAEEGIRFSQAYAAAPVCTPFRVSTMTGRYPARLPVGLREPLTGRPHDMNIGLPADHPTLSSLLKANGYETALVGKWHLGLLSEHHPRRHGFDEFFGILHGGADYFTHEDLSEREGLYENETVIEREGYLTELFTERAVEFISRPRNGPFFLSLQYTAPHWPWQGPGDSTRQDTLSGWDRWVGGGSPEIYAEMVKSLDQGIGHVLKAVDATGLREKTLIIFTSDNGGEQYSSMGPFTGGKMELWEGGIRVPAMMRWPGIIRAGSETDQVVVSMDWTATILAAAEAEPDPNYPLDGMNLLPISSGETPTLPRTLWWRTSQRTNHHALRDGDWKFLKDGEAEYLFNLAADPGEQHDVKEVQSELFQQLKRKFAAVASEMLEPVPLEQTN